MATETVEKLAFLLAGWVLSSLTVSATAIWRRRKETRRVFTQLWRLLEEIGVHFELAEAWRKAGGIETVLELFDLEEEWRTQIPPAPPELPDDFDSVIKSVAEWEAARGKRDITKNLFGLKAKLTLMSQVYTGIAACAKNPELGEVPERALTAYSDMRQEFDNQIRSLFSRIAPLRRMWVLRRVDRVKRKLAIRRRLARRPKKRPETA